MDAIVREAARARLRPFAVRAIERQAQYASLSEIDAETVLGEIDAATRLALAGELPDVPPMSEREMLAELAALHRGEGLGELSGWFKKLRKSVKKIEDGARSIGRKVEDVHKTVFKKVVVPIGAPTIARKMDHREEYKAKAAAAKARYDASGGTDLLAYQQWQNYSALADKALKNIQRQVQTGAAVVAAVVAAPVVGKLVSGPVGKLTAGGSGSLIDQAQDVKKLADQVSALRDQSQAQAVTEYAEAAAEPVEPAPVEPAKPATAAGLSWLLPVGAIATALLF